MAFEFYQTGQAKTNYLRFARINSINTSNIRSKIMKKGQFKLNNFKTKYPITKIPIKNPRRLFAKIKEKRKKRNKNKMKKVGIKIEN